MNAFEEFPEDYEPSHTEIVAQASRRLRFHDRSAPNTLIGLTRVPFKDGTTMNFEFYKPAVYEHNGIHYNVLLSVVLRTFHVSNEGALSDLKVYLVLNHPNEDKVHNAYFTVTNCGTENPVVGELRFLQQDELVDNHYDAYKLYNFLYNYGINGIVIKDD